MGADIAKRRSTTFFGQRLTREQLSDVRRTVELFPSLSRHELAQTVCEHLDWRAGSGENSVQACLKMLEVLEREGYVTLPARDESQVRGSRKSPDRSAGGEPGEAVECGLWQLGGVRLEQAVSDTEVALFNELVDRYHPRGYRSPVGCHMRYFIVDGSGRRLGCLLFQRATTGLKCRDRWIGWQDQTFKRRLDRVVCNTRFLVLPWVRVSNLASHVLSLAVARLGDDWKVRWDVRAAVVETFVDTSVHSGTAYRAAGWLRVGESASGKDVYVKELQEGARAILRGERRTRKRKTAAVASAVADGRFVELWRDFVGIVAEVAEDCDPQWRRRRRTIGTLLVMLFVFRLVFSHNRQGYQITINGLWEQCRMLGVSLPQDHPVAASAMCGARKKVSEQVFREAHRRIVDRIGEAGVETWCGRRLFAVDGTKINLPRELIGEGYRTPAADAWYPQGLVSCLYRLDDRMPIDFDLQAHGDERRMAAAHLAHLGSGDVVVYDRGYYSFELLWDHVRRGTDCVFRLQRNSAAEFRRFTESGDTEDFVRIVPGRNALRRWRAEHPGETPHAVTMRCVRVRTDGDDFIVATTLTDAGRFPYQALSDIYRGRWSIEELYKISKRLIEVGPFHSKSEHGVRQELYAHFTVVALTRSLGNLTERAIDDSMPDAASVQANFKNMLAAVAGKFEALMLGHAQMVADTVSDLLDAIAGCISVRRPGRSYPRVSKRPDERFRNANRRSGRKVRRKAPQPAS